MPAKCFYIRASAGCGSIIRCVQRHEHARARAYYYTYVCTDKSYLCLRDPELKKVLSGVYVALNHCVDGYVRTMCWHNRMGTERSSVAQCPTAVTSLE